MTRTRSAIVTVESLCAMMTAVLPLRRVFSPCCTRRSDGMSNELVASSRINTAGFARKALAKEIN